jgi:hypothetical protein
MLNHPLARQIWRWDAEVGRFTLAEETIRTPEMSWGPQPEETFEDWLRWTVNGAELAFRSGDYAAALEGYELVLGMAGDGWTPADDQPDWAGYARFRRAELALGSPPGVFRIERGRGLTRHSGELAHFCPDMATGALPAPRRWASAPCRVSIYTAIYIGSKAARCASRWTRLAYCTRAPAWPPTWLRTPS